MANKQIPIPYDRLIELMEDAADGAATPGVAVGLKQNTELAIRPDLSSLIGQPAGGQISVFILRSKSWREMRSTTCT